MTTLREALALGDEPGSNEYNSDLFKWAKELDLPLDEPCQQVTDASLAMGPASDPDWAYCRPLGFFTGPYYDGKHFETGKEGKIDNVWLVLDDEEWGIVMRDETPILGWHCSRGEFMRIPDNELHSYSDPKHAVVPARLGVKIPGVEMKGIHD